MDLLPESRLVMQRRPVWTASSCRRRRRLAFLPLPLPPSIHRSAQLQWSSLKWKRLASFVLLTHPTPQPLCWGTFSNHCRKKKEIPFDKEKQISSCVSITRRIAKKNEIWQKKSGNGYKYILRILLNMANKFGRSWDRHIYLEVSWIHMSVSYMVTWPVMFGYGKCWNSFGFFILVS